MILIVILQKEILEERKECFTQEKDLASGSDIVRESAKKEEKKRKN